MSFPQSWTVEVPFTLEDLIEIVKEEDSPDHLRAGMSSLDSSSMSRFFRGRVRWRRGLVNSRTHHHPIRGYGPRPAAPNRYDPEPNHPFVVTFPGRRERILRVADEKIDSLIPEPFKSLEKEGRITIPEVSVDLLQTFDDGCSAVLQTASSGQVIHNHEGILEVDLWKPGSLSISSPTCTIPSLPKPDLTKTLKKGSVLHIPKGWTSLTKDVDSSPHTAVSFSFH